MPSLRDEDSPRRRKKGYDGDTSSRTSRDKDRHRSSKKSHHRRSSTSRERDRSSSRLAKSSRSDLTSRSVKKVTMVVPEMERRSSTGTGTSSYPTFSKEHSREAVHSRDGTSNPKSPASSSGQKGDRVVTPPSPPLTEEEIEAKRAGIDPDKKKTGDRLKPDAHHSRKASSDSLRPVSSGSGSRRPSTPSHQISPEDSDASNLSERRRHKSKHSESTGASKSSHMSGRLSDEQTSTFTQQTQDSQATEKKSDRRPPGLTATDAYSPISQSSPRTPQSAVPPVNPQTPSSKPFQESYDPASGFVPPPPPPGGMPPPPPPIIPPEVNPRVDYLLENGGLPRPIPRTLLPRVQSQSAQSWNTYTSPRLNQGSAPSDLVQLFAPVQARLEDYMKVIEKNGSVAVATGYRSVARRLLDRVSTVFAREISNERCMCVMCASRPSLEVSEEEEKGISWGEILEFTVGRKELPQWPPFTLSSESGGLGIIGAEPMQKIDPDVPPEWRDHYLRQNAKTKRVVEGWLSKSDNIPTSAPAEIDDETLTFAITTHIEPERRHIFVALKRGLSQIPSSELEPANGQKNDVLPKVQTALQRLYRLAAPPREAECCLYLLNNQYLHNTLTTIAAVTDGEWDILISGRFDGFLVSGAETQMPSSAYGSAYGSAINMPSAPSRGPTATPLSRNATPFSANGGVPLPRGGTPFSPLRNDWAGMLPSRGATPVPGTAAPAPVQIDEDTEICVLAEIEREILRGMEDLEDQFERLHYRAEAVRERLRARAAGLALTANARRGSAASEPGARLSTPGIYGGNWTPDLQEGMYLDDGRSELAPDDSASNIGFGSRRHRRDGRTSRTTRTPAPVAEEDELPEGGEKKSGSFRRRR